MRIDSVVVGNLETNCYLLFDDKNKEVILIDPGDEADKILSKVEGYKIIAILVTHTHDDHIGAIPTITDSIKCPIYDKYNLEEGMFKINNFEFDVIYTPGHKEDQIVFYFKKDKCMFVGDFIFEGSIGRMDLPGGDPMEMINSIKKILTYDKNIVLYPGHGDKTTLKNEEKALEYYVSII
jgi:glyoxylase-like metal-dependent hydrolase (beta-lactamase superfamily II)